MNNNVVVCYLDSEEEVRNDQSIDGEFDLVLESYNGKWSVINVYKMKYNWNNRYDSYE